MIKNKKGFTLVELLAVIIVLIVIILIAINAIRKSVDDTLDNTIVANSGMFIKTANSFIGDKSISDPNYDSGTLTVAELFENGLSMSGTKPDSGGIVFYNSEVIYGCLMYDGYMTVYENGSVTKPKKDSCPDDFSDFSVDREFDYTGSEQAFKALLSGTYKLEVWGAQGGDKVALKGGTGGYSVGYVYLNKNDTLYVNVGGKPTDNNGGYNGGGGHSNYNSGTVCSSGGGATHIALKSGILSTLGNDVSSILIVAGGGGGLDTYYDKKGASGGGYLGNNSDTSSYGTAKGATQTTGGAPANSSATNGSFGLGGSQTNSSNSGGGGGGGFYGGAGGYGSGGGGGSGYIGNTKLFNKVMYCNGCAEIEYEPVKTISTTCSSIEPTENCSKSGDGYAKITYISPDKQNNSPIKYLYNYGDEFNDVTGGWLTQNIQGNGRSEKLPSSLYIWASREGSSESRVYTKNAIDYTGYTKVNVIYEIVSTYTTGTYGGLVFLSGSKDVWFSKRGVGTYYDSVDISSLSSEILYFRDWDVNIKILSVWLSND